MITEDYEEFSIPEKEPPGRNSRSLLFSIFLVMLAFFIMLNALSLRDQKRENYSKKSLQKSFVASERVVTTPISISHEEKKEEIASNAAKSPDAAKASGTPLNNFGELEKIAKEPLEIVKGSVEQEGNILRMIIPIDSFFVPGDANIQEFQAKFLKRLADQIYRYPYISVEFSMPNNDSLSVKRAASFAKLMTEMGIAKQNIKPGIKPGNEEYLAISFHLRSQEPE